MTDQNGHTTPPTDPAGPKCTPADYVPDLTGTRSVPPFVASGVRMFSFPVAAHISKLNDLCNKYLNDPAPNAHAWRPLGAMFYIQILQYDRLVSQPYEDFGFIRQNELVFQIPIISPTKPTLPNVGFFSAYLVVDNPLSLTIGREVFGYPKTFGGFQIEPNQIAVTNWLTPTQGPDVEYAEHPLLEQSAYTMGPSLAQNARESLWPFGPASSLFRQEGKSYEEETAPPFELDEVAWPLLFDATSTPIVHTEVSVQALKQTDSTTFLTPGPQQAAYQARISAISVPSNLAGTGLMVAGPLTLHQYDPLNLIDIFGIHTAFGKVPVYHPHWLDLDFTVRDTTLLTCHSECCGEPAASPS